MKIKTYGTEEGRTKVRRQDTHATELDEAGVAIKEIQRRLGHKSEMTTRRVYVHHTDEMRMQSIEIINTMYKYT